MQFFLSPYELCEKQTLKIRRGYLLKVTANDFDAGYADIHPWTEFGDPAYEAIPLLLKKIEAYFLDPKPSAFLIPSLLNNSLLFAFRDGLARSQNKLLNQDISLTNHFSLLKLQDENLDKILSLGFKRIKVKMGLDFIGEVKLLDKLCKSIPDDVLLRLDFNTKGKVQYLERILHLKEKIEYIEDPFLNPKDWNMPWSFAYDQPPFLEKEVSVQWHVIKPAKQKFADDVMKAAQQPLSFKNYMPSLMPFAMKASIEKNIVFTSYLDHPVGIAHAFHEATLFGKQKTPYGLMTHDIYEENDFFSYIKTKGSQMAFSGTLGIGFDEALRNQKWVGL